jgi:hypothetical protein
MTSLETVTVDQATLEAMVIPEILPLCVGKPPGYFGVLLIDRLTKGAWTKHTRFLLENGESATPMIRKGPPEPAGSWIQYASCRGQRMYYDTFGAHYTKITRTDRQMEREALATCQRCPVMIQCRGWALQEIEPAVDHVAGGMTPRQRAEYRRRRERLL